MVEQVQATGVATFQRDVIDASREVPVIVDFWAAWCAPCRMLTPVLERIATAFADQVRVFKVDTDAEQQLAGQFHIRSIPTVMLFRDGKLAGQFVGAQPEHAVREWLKPFLPAAETGVLDQARALRRQGDPDRARELLQNALATDAGDTAVREELVELALEAGNLEDARVLLAGLPADGQDSDRARSLGARLYFAGEMAEVTGGTADLDALYQEGLRAASAGRMTAAAEAFLTLAERSRAYREDAGRRALLQLFEVLGPDAPLVAEYRRKLGRVLN